MLSLGVTQLRSRTLYTIESGFFGHLRGVFEFLDDCLRIIKSGGLISCKCVPPRDRTNNVLSRNPVDLEDA